MASFPPVLFGLPSAPLYFPPGQLPPGLYVPGTIISGSPGGLGAAPASSTTPKTGDKLTPAEAQQFGVPIGSLWGRIGGGVDGDATYAPETDAEDVRGTQV